MKNKKRLIDANAFLKSLEWEVGDVREKNEYSDYLETEYGFSRDAINQLVQNAPTVYAVEVVHGLWVTDEKGVTYCGRCKVIDDFASVHNYCPNCGAKMDK